MVEPGPIIGKHLDLSLWHRLKEGIRSGEQTLTTRKMLTKIGSRVGTDQHGRVDRRVIRKITGDASVLYEEGVSLAFVISGSVRIGTAHLDHRLAESVLDQQIAAGVGQSFLTEAWRDSFLSHDMVTAQLLIGDLETTEEVANLYGFLDRCWQLGITPIINKNDPLYDYEVRQLTENPNKDLDNDILTEQVAQIGGVDTVVFLTSEAGIRNSSRKVVPHLHYADDLSDYNISFSRETSDGGTGGMGSKFLAASSLASFGMNVYIGDGRRRGCLLKPALGLPFGTRVDANN